MGSGTGMDMGNSTMSGMDHEGMDMGGGCKVRFGSSMVLLAHGRSSQISMLWVSLFALVHT